MTTSSTSNKFSASGVRGTTCKDSGQGFAAGWGEFPHFSVLPDERKRWLRGEREKECSKSLRGLTSLATSTEKPGGRDGAVGRRYWSQLLLFSTFYPAEPTGTTTPSPAPTTTTTKTTRTTSARVGKAATYFNSSFPCEFLAWTYDRLSVPYLSASPNLDAFGLSNSGY